MWANETEQKRIVREYLKLKQSDKSLTVKQIAKKLGTSDTSLFRMRKRFEKEIMESSDKNEDVIPEVLTGIVTDEVNKFYPIVEEEEETVKGFVTSKDEDAFDAIPFEVSIPAGMTGKKREIVLHYTVFNDLEIEEI